MSAAEIVGLILALLAMGVGLLGCIVPGLPGAPLVLAAAFGHRLYFGPHGASNAVMITLLVLAILSIVLDQVASLWGAKKFGATWRGVTGAAVGGLVGIFFNLPGILLGPFIGALLFELIGGREMQQSARAGLGATLGLFAGVIGKCAICAAMIALFAVNVIYRSVH